MCKKYPTTFVRHTGTQLSEGNDVGVGGPDLAHDNVDDAGVLICVGRIGGRARAQVVTVSVVMRM